MATIEDFMDLDIRVGEIVRAEDFPESRKPMYKLTINFGEELGERQSCAQLITRYTKEELVGRQVLGVVNLPPRQIGPAISEVLVLGASDSEGRCILIMPDINAPLGSKLY